MAGAIAPATAMHWDQDHPGAKAPGQRPTRHRRALRPRWAGRWPFVVPGPTDLQGTVARGRGKRGAFPVPARRGEWPDPDAMAGAIAPAKAPRWDQDQPGAKAPGQRPTRPWRALASVGAGCTGLGGSVPRGRGNAVRFLFPPGRARAPSPLQWQGPSPLPQRCAGISTSRGPQPPASARPAHGGRFSPAGSGAGLCWCGLHRSWWQRSARAGKRGAFPVPARRGESSFTAEMAGAIAPATALHWHQGQPGATAPGQRPARPRRALRPRRAGRWPAVARAAWVFVAPPRAGRANAGRVSCSRPKGQSLSPDREESPRRQAVGLLFQHPAPPARPR